MKKDNIITPKQDAFIDELRELFFKYMAKESNVSCRWYGCACLLETLYLFLMNTPNWREYQVDCHEKLTTIFKEIGWVAMETYDKTFGVDK